MAGNIIKRRSLQGPLGFMRSGLDDLFQDFFKEFNIEPFGRTALAESVFVPRIDMAEDEKKYTISAELPGMEPKDVEIDLNDDVLTIKGEKKSEHKEEEKGRYHIERSYGSFSRAISLPADVDTEQVDAAFKNGVLTINVPKSQKAQAKAKKIQIKT